MADPLGIAAVVPDDSYAFPHAAWIVVRKKHLSDPFVPDHSQLDVFFSVLSRPCCRPVFHLTCGQHPRL